MALETTERSPTVSSEVMDREVELLQGERPERIMEVERESVATARKHPKALCSPVAPRADDRADVHLDAWLESGSGIFQVAACGGSTQRGNLHTRPDRGEWRIPPPIPQESRC